MPITKSAKKALSVDRRRKSENDDVRAKIKGAVKGVKIAVRSGASDLTEKLTAAYSELDLAAKKNVIHKNKAARLKSRLTKAIAKAEANPVEAKPAKKAAAKKTTKKAK